jgi:hypothetical protein
MTLMFKDLILDGNSARGNQDSLCAASFDLSPRRDRFLARVLPCNMPLGRGQCFAGAPLSIVAGQGQG